MAIWLIGLSYGREGLEDHINTTSIDPVTKRDDAPGGREELAVVRPGSVARDGAREGVAHDEGRRQLTTL